MSEPSRRRCARCAHSALARRAGLGGYLDVLECRLTAPSSSHGWPTVKAEECCGQFKASTTEPKKGMTRHEVMVHDNNANLEQSLGTIPSLEFLFRGAKPQ